MKEKKQKTSYKKTPYDEDLKKCIKDLNEYYSELNRFEHILEHKNFKIFDIGMVQDMICIIQDKIEDTLNRRMEIENQILSFKNEK
jgi:hypothetical protein